jgi:chemotaxis protein methyltransferase CheR
MADITFLNDADFALFQAIIYKECVINFTNTNRSVLESRLRECLRENKLATVKDYYNVIVKSTEQLKSFLDAVTTNLTRFFRNQPHFDALEHFVIPELLKIKQPTGNFSLKIWSAGCSSGEEPYTIAMLLSEILPISWKFDIIASDLSLKMLMTAQEGFYDESHIVGIPENYLKKYFDKIEKGYKVKDVLKKHIRFDYHNLKNDAGQRGMDIIFCRNVLIYFDEPTQNMIVNKFYDSMTNPGFLYIGHSESLFGMKTNFEFVKTEWTTLYKKKGV